jgi:hypothetical protein
VPGVCSSSEVLSTRNRNFEALVFFIPPFISKFFPSDRWGRKHIAHRLLHAAVPASRSSSLGWRPKQPVFRGIVRQLLPEAASSNEPADSRNSGNQIAWMLVDPFDLIHEFRASSVQALTSSELHRFNRGRYDLQRHFLDGVRLDRATASRIRAVPHPRRSGSRSPQTRLRIPAALRAHCRS